jgi:hypothetical protein
VRDDETSCPFCCVALEARQPRARAGAAKGSSRATLFVVQAALVASSACAVSRRPGEVPADPDGKTKDSSVEKMHAKAGSSGAATAGNTGTAGSISTAGSMSVAGSLSAAGSRGEPSDAGATTTDGEVLVVDAAAEEEDASFVPIPIYGGPFVDPRKRAKV